MLIHTIKHCFQEIESHRKQHLVEAGIEPSLLDTLGHDPLM